MIRTSSGFKGWGKEGDREALPCIGVAGGVDSCALDWFQSGVTGWSNPLGICGHVCDSGEEGVHALGSSVCWPSAAAWFIKPPPVGVERPGKAEELSSRFANAAVSPRWCVGEGGAGIPV